MKRATRKQQSKPHIDDLSLAMHEFHLAMSRALREHPSMSQAQERAAHAAREILVRKLNAMGLTDKLDWTLRV